MFKGDVSFPGKTPPWDFLIFIKNQIEILQELCVFPDLQVKLQPFAKCLRLTLVSM